MTPHSVAPTRSFRPAAGNVVAAVPPRIPGAHPAVDASALSTSLADHRRFLYRYAMSRVRHKETADEVVQDTLVAALEGMENFQGQSSLRTWLTGILKHKVTDHQRREGRTPVRIGYLTPADPDARSDDMGEEDAIAGGGWSNPASAGPGPEQAYESARFWETIECCLAALPPLAGRAFYLCEIEGLSTDEICAELGITSNYCWVMLHRARTKLRQSLQERWFGSVASAGPAAAAAATERPSRAGLSRARRSPIRSRCGVAERRADAAR
jgi:RNA polymerase sigma-70 factor (ECF subfamily)